MIQNFVAQSKQTRVLPCTAFVYVKIGCGEYKKFNAILDSASQTSFITNNCATFLGLKKNKSNIPVGGLNGATVTVGQQVNTVLSSKNNEFVMDIEFLVVPKITDLTSSQQIDIDYIQLPKGITLADAQFFEPSKIDILLGAKTFFEILKPNQIRISKETLLPNTYFGYLVTGSGQSNSNEISCHLSIEDTLL
ncbi:integrase catalytic domain-containing protein [Trichonephila clavipes]|nr:integrase catalytic domain-containing protein [Trichonephila clavipes]